MASNYGGPGGDPPHREQRAGKPASGSPLCPRCDLETDRTHVRVSQGIHPWSMTVRIVDPMICSICLAEWETMRVLGVPLLLLPGAR